MEWQDLKIAPVDTPVIIADTTGRVGEGSFYIVTDATLCHGQQIGAVAARFLKPDAWGEHECRAVAWMPMPSHPGV